jgi:hypothetical protein
MGAPYGDDAPAPCNCSAKTGYGACRCSWRRPRCQYIACRSYAIWTDVDSGEQFCGAHAVLRMNSDDEDDSKEKRREFAAEYARDAAREHGR